MDTFKRFIFVMSIFLVLINPLSALAATPTSGPSDNELVLSKMILEREVHKLTKSIELDKALGNITQDDTTEQIENLKLCKAQMLSVLSGEFTDFEVKPTTKILAASFDIGRTERIVRAAALRERIQRGLTIAKRIVDPRFTDIPWLKGKMAEYPLKREVVRSFAENPWTKYVAAISEKKIFDRSIEGTAIYLGKGYFVTAWHVLSEIEGFRTKELFVGTAEREESAVSPKNVFKIDSRTIMEDPAHDIVIFRVLDAEGGITAREAFEEAPICVDGHVSVQSRLRAAGYPRGNIFVCSTINCFVTKYQDSWIVDDPSDPVGQIRAIGHTWRGYSGGPLIDMDRNCVVGILLNQTGPDYEGYREPRVPATYENAFGGVHIRYAIQLRDKAIGESTKYLRFHAL